jgi:transposase
VYEQPAQVARSAVAGAAASEATTHFFCKPFPTKIRANFLHIFQQWLIAGVSGRRQTELAEQFRLAQVRA